MAVRPLNPDLIELQCTNVTNGGIKVCLRLSSIIEEATRSRSIGPGTVDSVS